MKIKTGVIILPKDFGRSTSGKRCVGCNKFGSALCELCEVHSKCIICDCVLRDNWISYSYESVIKDKQNMYHEYKQKVHSTYQPFNEHLCEGCIDWEERRKHKCFLCDTKFLNTQENYKSNGNLCEKCSKDINIRMGKISIFYTTDKIDEIPRQHQARIKHSYPQKKID